MLMSSENHGQFGKPPLLVAIVLVLLIYSCRPCAARQDPQGRHGDGRGDQCKLCLFVLLPVAGVVLVAAVAALVICLLRRRNRDAAAVTGDVQNGEHMVPPKAASANNVVKTQKNSGSTGDSSSWNVLYDNPMSINPTMVRSPMFRSSPTRAARAPSPVRAGSPLRRSRPPVPGLAKRKKAEDPLAMYSPCLSVLLKEFDYEQLQGATNNFGRKHQLGRRGGPWVVFKGTKFVKDEGLPTTVAIKRFRGTFTDEQCKLIRADLKGRFTMRHKNLVSLLGYSLGKGRFHLVYEYMTNGSLEQYLFRDTNGGQILSWLLRHNIVKDVAQGLCQLHVANMPHGSITASSIMLDHDSTAHLDDHFGYRPELVIGSASGSSVSAGGDPAALQADIADLGAVVLELVTGRRHASAAGVWNATTTTTTPLVDWVWELHSQGRLLDAVDSALVEDWFNRDQAFKLLLLGLACSHPDPNLRPSIHDVRKVLLDIMPLPEVPSSTPTTN